MAASCGGGMREREKDGQDREMEEKGRKRV